MQPMVLNNSVEEIEKEKREKRRQRGERVFNMTGKVRYPSILILIPANQLCHNLASTSGSIGPYSSKISTTTSNCFE